MTQPKPKLPAIKSASAKAKRSSSKVTPPVKRGAGSVARPTKATLSRAMPLAPSPTVARSVSLKSRIEALPRPLRAQEPTAQAAPVEESSTAKSKQMARIALAVRARAMRPVTPTTKSKAKAPSTKPELVDTPAKIRPIEQTVGVTSEAVSRRTGKSWAAWFALLDAAGAAKLDHKGIVAVLAQRHGVGPWWQQMITGAYEQARGRRDKPELDEGFEVGITKTLELPLPKLFRLWSESAERNKWLCDDRFSIHKATASKSIRARWGRGVSRIAVDFSDKGAGKSQVTLQHNHIESAAAAKQMKAYWAKKIDALEALTRA